MVELKIHRFDTDAVQFSVGLMRVMLKYDCASQYWHCWPSRPHAADALHATLPYWHIVPSIPSLPIRQFTYQDVLVLGFMDQCNCWWSPRLLLVITAVVLAIFLAGEKH